MNKAPTVDDSMRAVIDVYKNGVDVTLIDESLKLTPEERIRRLQELHVFAEELRRAGRELDGHQV